MRRDNQNFVVAVERSLLNIFLYLPWTQVAQALIYPRTAGHSNCRDDPATNIAYAVTGTTVRVSAAARSSMTITLVWMICMMSMMPSSSTAVILDNTLVHGRKVGFVTAMGGSAAVIVYIMLSVAVGMFISSVGIWVNLLEGMGAVYLAALGLTSFLEAFSSEVDGGYRERPAKGRRAFLSGLLTTCLSPKTAIFYLVILSQHGYPGMPVIVGIIMAGVLHIFFRLAWYGFWIHLIAPMRFVVTGLSMQRSMRLITGTMMIALSFYIIL